MIQHQFRYQDTTSFASTHYVLMHMHIMTMAMAAQCFGLYLATACSVNATVTL